MSLCHEGIWGFENLYFFQVLVKLSPEEMNGSFKNICFASGAHCFQLMYTVLK